MMASRLLTFLIAVFALGVAHKARGQVNVAVGVHGSYDVEKGEPLVGLNALFDANLPLKINLSVDYFPDRRGGGFTGSPRIIHTLILGSHLLLDVLPRAVPASIYLKLGPSMFINASCEFGDCTSFGIDAGIGMGLSFDRLHPFLQAEVRRGNLPLYLVGGGLRLEL